MRIMVLGLRGFPNVAGGVETHSEQLYPRLRELGCDIDVIVRKGHWVRSTVADFEGIRFHRLWSPRRGGLEALVHSFLGVLYAGWQRPDVLHIHAVGPALVTPLARLLGLRVVVTHHGPDYDREKWSRAAKWILRLGERAGMRFAHARIAISHGISESVRRRYGSHCVCIPNGVAAPALSAPADVLDALALEAGHYVLAVGRLVPEKRHADLIMAFEQARLSGWKLVIVGGFDERNACLRRLRAMAADRADVVLAGYRTGDELAALYLNAGVFALPSSHEGLPIALLEAMSYGLRVVASDISANREVGLDARQYFRLGDVPDLASQLAAAVDESLDEDARVRVREWVTRTYDWRGIASRTLDVYREVATPCGPGDSPSLSTS